MNMVFAAAVTGGLLTACAPTARVSTEEARIQETVCCSVSSCSGVIPRVLCYLPRTGCSVRRRASRMCRIRQQVGRSSHGNEQIVIFINFLCSIVADRLTARGDEPSHDERAVNSGALLGCPCTHHTQQPSTHDT